VVLLATWNGARFLPRQLESLAAQRGIAWRLLWRDDGSADATLALLEEFAAAQPAGRVLHLDAPSGRLGPARGFLALLAASPEPEAPHAFCDQDDLWLPDKLARAAAALAEIPAGMPGLYCGRQILAGPDLAPRGPSPLPRRPPGFANALVQNIATGCTTVLNPAARRLLLAAPPPPEGSMHDWWAYLLVSGCGGRVIFDPEPTVLYRQHGGNAVGATAPVPLRALRALRRGPAAFLALLAAHRRVLLAAAPELPLTPEARVVLAETAALADRRPWRRLAALRRAGLYRQSPAEDATLRLWLALRPMR
jgi:glycosyltransferase involved in cell wall biosynthesis